MKVTKTILGLICIGLLFTACNKDKTKGGLNKLTYKDQTFSGSIDNGKVLDDLSWAWSSNMACFVETVKDQYKGNHVFYKIEIPTNSTIDIYMTPTNPGDEMALYGYSKAAGDETIPPGISSSVSCEASPSNSNGAKTGEQHVYFNAINNPYAVIFGIAGADGLTEGGFEIRIDVEN
ncbi:MAG: hypothetical protein AB8B74_08450 [Crocinitomicaceae bacterium]